MQQAVARGYSGRTIITGPAADGATIVASD
jgi:hypothetical protein